MGNILRCCLGNGLYSKVNRQLSDCSNLAAIQINRTANCVCQHNLNGPITNIHAGSCWHIRVMVQSEQWLSSTWPNTGPSSSISYLVHTQAPLQHCNRKVVWWIQYNIFVPPYNLIGWIGNYPTSTASLRANHLALLTPLQTYLAHPPI